MTYLNLIQHVILEECDLMDISQIINLFLSTSQMKYIIWQLKALFHQSFSQPIGTIQFNINSVLNLLEAIRITDSNIKFYQASSSEMFGKVGKLTYNRTYTVSSIKSICHF